MKDLFKILISPTLVVYSSIIKMRNNYFDNGKFKSEKVNSKVISIGNITVGGSGKTPTVIYVTNMLKEAGKKVGILSRGYGRKTKGYLLVSKGDKILTDVDDCGDEMYLATDECGVASAVCEKRVEGAQKLLSEVPLDVIVLDDAFQHRWIYRDIDILIFDQKFLLKTGTIEQKMLPLGMMREPFSSAKRADVILINRKFDEKKKISKKILDNFKGKKLFYAHYEASGFYDLKSHEFFKIEEFHGQKSLVVCGIARPYSFLRVLEQNNVDISNKILFPDHKDYSGKEVEEIRKKFYDTNSYSVVTTQKDAVKLKKFAKELDDIDIYYLKIDLKIEKEEEFKETIFNIIN